jgi:hypothetical protein
MVCTSFAANVLALAPRGFLERNTQFAFFHGFDQARDIFVEAFLHLRELCFEFFDSFLLALDPLGAQLLAFLFERAPLGRHLLLHAVEFVATPVQVRDQVGGFARFRS